MDNWDYDCAESILFELTGTTTPTHEDVKQYGLGDIAGELVGRGVTFTHTVTMIVAGGEPTAIMEIYEFPDDSSFIIERGPSDFNFSGELQ